MRLLLVLAAATTLSHARYPICVDPLHPMYNGACGKRIQDGVKYNFYTARKLCDSIGADLPMVMSDEDNENLRIAADGKKIILGIVPNTCGWQDGSDLDYMNYRVGECHRYKYTTLDPETGKWEKEGTDLEDIPFIDTVICWRRPHFSDRCGNFAEGGPTSPFCYDYHVEELSWNEAEAVCARDDATLTVILAKKVNVFIREMAYEHPEHNLMYKPMHIGLSSVNGSNYTWADGTQMDYNNFAMGYPRPGIGNCGAMDVEEAGTWINEDCDTQPMRFFCSRNNAGKPMKDECSEESVYKSGDDIFSPGYPLHYSDRKCDYIVIGQPGQRVRVEVRKFAVNTCCAHLTIYDGKFGKNEIVKLTGEHPSTNFTSTQPSVRISWNSSERAHMLGWHLRVFVETPNISCGQTPVKPNLSQERIVGGLTALPYSWPWQIVWCSLGWFGGCSLECGGSVIDNGWVMTAGSCVFDDMNPKNWQVKAGIHKEDATTESGEQVSKVKAIHLHPKYESGTSKKNDISLIELETPLKYSDHVQPVCLPDDDTAVIAKPNSAYITGWGSTKEQGDVSIQLRQAKVPFVDYPSCKKEYPGQIVDNIMVCAGAEGVDFCKGDTGGPMVIQGASGTWFQVGISSFGNGCGEKGEAGVYSRVTAYCDFISTTTNGTVSCQPIA